jgi:CBS domain-containing protein
MYVREVMTANVNYVAPDARLPVVARLMRDEDIGSVPVAENDRLIGMITDRDLVVRALADGLDLSAASAREVMSPKILYCIDDQSVDDVLNNMADNQVRRLPVINRQKRLVGMVSLGDLSRAADRRAGNALKQITQPDAA